MVLHLELKCDLHLRLLGKDFFVTQIFWANVEFVLYYVTTPDDYPHLDIS